jgi:uncharacterized membrane protein YidH (DUF202 family)
MRVAGIVLIVLGLIALVYGGIGYNRERTVIDIGPIKATATEHHTLPVSPIAGTIAILAGILLVVTPGRRLK